MLEENFQITPEQEKPLISFAEYRQLCDTADNFRKTGLLSETNYAAVLQDTRTVFGAHEGKRIPLLIPAEYEDGYDVTRCQELTGKQNIFLSGIPHLDTENTSVVSKAIDDQSAIILEVPGTAGSDSLTMFDQWGLQVNDFLDPRIPMPESQAAAMGFFEFSVNTKDKSVAPKSRNEAWREYKQQKDLPDMPAIDSNAVYLFSGAELVRNAQIMDQLWRISQAGFGEVLGQYHPVSMEESRDFFEYQLLGDHTYTAVKYVDGEPICFGALDSGIEHCVWLNENSTIVKELTAGATERGEKILFFSEVISNGEKGAGYAPEIFGLHFDMIAQTQQPYTVTFESTNLSELYIPKLILRTEEESLAHISRDIHKTDSLSYKYVTTREV